MMEYPGEENTSAILETLLTYSVSFNMTSDANAALIYIIWVVSLVVRNITVRF